MWLWFFTVIVIRQRKSIHRNREQAEEYFDFDNSKNLKRLFSAIHSTCGYYLNEDVEKAGIKILASMQTEKNFGALYKVIKFILAVKKSSSCLDYLLETDLGEGKLIDIFFPTFSQHLQKDLLKLIKACFGAQTEQFNIKTLNQAECYALLLLPLHQNKVDCKALMMQFPQSIQEEIVQNLQNKKLLNWVEFYRNELKSNEKEDKQDKTPLQNNSLFSSNIISENKPMHAKKSKPEKVNQPGLFAKNPVKKNVVKKDQPKVAVKQTRKKNHK